MGVSTVGGFHYWVFVLYFLCSNWTLHSLGQRLAEDSNKTVFFINGSIVCQSWIEKKKNPVNYFLITTISMWLTGLHVPLTLSYFVPGQHWVALQSHSCMLEFLCQLSRFSFSGKWFVTEEEIMSMTQKFKFKMLQSFPAVVGKWTEMAETFDENHSFMPSLVSQLPKKGELSLPLRLQSSFTGNLWTNIRSACSWGERISTNERRKLWHFPNYFLGKLKWVFFAPASHYLLGNFNSISPEGCKSIVSTDVQDEHILFYISSTLINVLPVQM